MKECRCQVLAVATIRVAGGASVAVMRPHRRGYPVGVIRISIEVSNAHSARAGRNHPVHESPGVATDHRMENALMNADGLYKRRMRAIAVHGVVFGPVVAPDDSPKIAHRSHGNLLA